MARICRARLVAIAVLTAVALAGCAKPSLSRPQLRAITAEAVAAAQRIAGRKSEITVRPASRPYLFGLQRRRGADDIYVSLSKPSQTTALRRALVEIARRHGLAFSEITGSGVVRFDLAFHGTVTQSVRAVLPLASTRTQRFAESSRKGPRLAIIIDDLGEDPAAADKVLALPFPLSASVLPHLPYSSEIAEQAFRRGDQVLLHLPMQAESESVKQEKTELRVGMTSSEVQYLLSDMLATVPHAVGVNNHEGSRATADPALMAELMPVLRTRNLFFIDSRTTAATVAFESAERAGVLTASRKVFLDDTPTREAVLEQLNLAARDAERNGSAIAIGHPHPATIAALARGIPPIEARGIRMVFASTLVH